MRAIWKGETIAESDDTVYVEGNHYFPASAVNRKYLQASATHTTCPWKGVASYYNIRVDEALNEDAAWYYPDPKAEAKHIQGRIAFWRGVQVIE